MRLLSKIARQIRFAFAETLDGYENPELVEVIFQKTKENEIDRFFDLAMSEVFGIELEPDDKDGMLLD
jgi:hypothetical protein